MKKNVFILALLSTGFLFAQKKPAAKPVLSTTTAPATLTDDQKASYYIGMDIAGNMKKQGLNVNVDYLAKGMKDQLSGGNTLLPAEDMPAFLQNYVKNLAQKKLTEQKKIGTELVAKNKSNPNIKTTASGLQYEILKEGEGKVHPTDKDNVSVTYTGKLVDGTVFDSTDKNGGKPIDIPLNGVIKGWTEGIQLMTKGAKYRFYIPSDLAYGDQGGGNVIPPGATLIFDVGLEEIKPQEIVPAQATPAAPPAQTK